MTMRPARFWPAVLLTTGALALAGCGSSDDGVVVDVVQRLGRSRVGQRPVAAVRARPPPASPARSRSR